MTTPTTLGRAAKIGLWIRNHWALIKATAQRLYEKWKSEPVKTTGYGIIAAVVAFFAAEGVVDSNVTNLVTSLVTLGAGAPVVHAVDSATKENIRKAAEAAKKEVAGRFVGK